MSGIYLLLFENTDTLFTDMDDGGRNRWDHGAVERIQKAKRAKKIKQRTQGKKRKMLINELEKDALPSVIVASEFGVPGADAERDEQQMIESSTLEKFQKKPKKRATEHRACAAQANVGSEGCTPDTANPNNEASIDDDGGNKMSASKEQAVRANDERSSGRQPEHRTNTHNSAAERVVNFPFRKEFKKREAERLEREKERQRWQKEEEDYKKRLEKSSMSRKREVSQTRH